MEKQVKKTGTVHTLPTFNTTVGRRVFIVIAPKLFQKEIGTKKYLKEQFPQFGKEHFDIMKKYNSYLFAGEFNCICVVDNENHYRKLYQALTEKTTKDKPENDYRLMIRGIFSTHKAPYVDYFFPTIHSYHREAHRKCSTAILRKVQQGTKWKENIGTRALYDAQVVDNNDAISKTKIQKTKLLDLSHPEID